jgi:AraC family transcriptional regulator
MLIGKNCADHPAAAPQSHAWRARLARYHPNGEMAFHRHEEPWFCAVLSGLYEERVRTRSQEHTVDHMLFYPETTDHAQRFGPEGTVKLLFSPSPASLSYLASRKISMVDSPFVRSRAVSRIGARVSSEMTLADSHSRLAIECLLLELVAAFTYADPDRTEAGAPAWLIRLREWIEESEADVTTLDRLGQQFDRHPVHIAREFRRHYGRTVGGYLREKRTIKAALLLRAGAMPLAEVALACGYAGQASFTRAFKAVHGVTPSVFRAR